MLKYHIQTIEVGSGGAADITFNNIPQDYDDLEVVFSLRSNRPSATFDTVLLLINGSSSNHSRRTLYSEGAVVGSESGTNAIAGFANATNSTTSVFSNTKLYFPNYASNFAKSWSNDIVGENNAADNRLWIQANLWNSTQAISSLGLYSNTASTFLQYSSASLYGIKHGSSREVEVAAGGEISYSGGYTIHTFNSSGTFVANRNMDVEYLVVAGGGGGSQYTGAGGGGAGGYLASSMSVSPNSYLVSVGAGGAGGVNSSETVNGVNSSFSSLNALGGGGGGGYKGSFYAPKSGGSGGGGAYAVYTAGGLGLAGQGNDGGAGGGGDSGGGGGGASAVGGVGASSGGNGGAGLQWLNGFYYAGGGGGGRYPSGTAGSGGIGGGGNGGVNGSGVQPGTPNTGGGGGGNGNPTMSNAGGNGGSGVVIIRYLTPSS